MSHACPTIAQDDIESWHAHLYFDADTAAVAARVRDRAARELPVTVGRMHAQPVGPHPRGSCQLEFLPQHLRVVLEWLTCHRGGLTVFLHPNTGQVLPDHRDRAIWMGPSETLSLTALPAG